MMTSSIQGERIAITVDEIEMSGALWVPDDPIGIIVFPDGNGNHMRPPTDYVASVLRKARLGTLWLDLLGEQEARGTRVRNDIDLLTRRLDAACNWLRRHDATSDMPIGLFCINNSTAAAMQLAASRGKDIAVIVSRGGRPDLASYSALTKISAPTLLIVGSLDDGMINVNRAAYAALRCKKRFEIIPGATHAFDEPGSVEVVARLARGWFLQHACFTQS